MLVVEWDEAKAKANLAKHGISFEEAKRAFRDPFAVEFLDDRFDYGEDRFVLIATVGTRLLTVIYAEDADSYRLISARPSRTEQDAYFEAQG